MGAGGERVQARCLRARGGLSWGGCAVNGEGCQPRRWIYDPGEKPKRKHGWSKDEAGRGRLLAFLDDTPIWYEETADALRGGHWSRCWPLRPSPATWADHEPQEPGETKNQERRTTNQAPKKRTNDRPHPQYCAVFWLRLMSRAVSTGGCWKCRKKQGCWK